MINLYKQEWQKFKKKYLYFFIACIPLFFIFIINSYYIALQNPESSLLFIDMLREAWGIDGVGKEMSSSYMLGFILGQNLKSTLIIIFSGIIPFLLIPIYILTINGQMIGIVYATLGFTDMSLFDAIFKLTLPHGIFEIPALFYAVSIGLFVCYAVSKKIVLWKKEKDFRFRTLVKESLQSFFLIVLPLLIIAAVIESYITPLFMK